MTKTILLLIVILCSYSFAQDKAVNTDSLFQLYTQLKNHQFNVSDQPEQHKCAFGLVNSVKSSIDKFNAGQRQILKTLFDRIPRTNSIVSPAGYFRVHYNATGTEAPRYLSNLSSDENALLVAQALDSAYHFEVNYLQYPPPPPDNGAGGDNLYDVYIANIGSGGSGYYGYTEFENEITPGSNTYTSYMVIDDDYLGFYSSGINGARVTVAHELHHGIQMGNYIYRGSDLYYYELSSTAMEEFVYDSINDYYAYMYSYFQNTSLSITQQNGYNVAILNLFLQKRFDHNLLRHIWELMPADTAINAINRALLERGSSFQAEYAAFAVWTFFTNYRAEVQYFEEGAHYPLVRPLQVINFSPPEDSVRANSKPAGNCFLFFIKGIDTLAAVISNADIRTALTNPDTDQPFTYSLFNYESPGSVKLTNDYYMSFSAARPNFWQTTEILNRLIVKDGLNNEITVDFPFPAPFYYSRSYQTGSSIFIPVKNALSATVELSVFSIGMDLVYSNSWQPIVSKVNTSRFLGVEWDLGAQAKLATGVYIYVIKSGDEIIKGKLTIFND